MRKLPENRKLACVVLAGVILCSVFGIGTAKLSSARREAVNVFIEGTDTALSVRHSMDAYLLRAAEAGVKFAEEADILLPEGKTDALKGYCAVMKDTKAEIADRYAAYTSFATETESVYTLLIKSGSDLKEAEYHYKDILSCENLIKNDAYGTYARAFNQETDGFPASVISSVFGLDELDTFGG